jgi:UDP-hydrolysing UDP-N-acetyl-D-glucosamine 2-epimerase
MRSIGIVTVARSDYGIYLPVLRRINANPELELRIIAAGMHLSPEFGMTADVIEKDGFAIDERVEMLVSSDTPEGISKSIGLGIIGFSQVYARKRPDILVVLGDRFEMLAAAAASLPFSIPIAHLHGGESTEGLIDEPIRHSITKMSHLHFASAEFYAKRIMQMGEEPWRVTVSGAPSLDNLNEIELLSRDDLSTRFGIADEPFLLVTIHPVTLEYERTEEQAAEMLNAIGESGMQTVFTYPNADTKGRAIIEAINRFADGNPKAKCLVNVGTQAYFSLMAHAAAMVGNSSSGIIEAASFRLPVVNIGNRQRGRIHRENVIDVPCERASIAEAIRRAVSADFSKSLDGLVNPYGDGHASERIVERLKSVELDSLIIKRFHDQQEPSKALTPV